MLSLRILLAEDVAMVRGALVALIELEPDMKVVAAIERGDDIVPQALALRPNVAIIDIDLPGLDGLTAAAQLHAELPSCPTLIVTNLGRTGNLRRALSAREIEVLRIAAGGAEPTEIATVLHLSVGTVRNYLTNIVTKLNARNRLDAVRAAREA